MLKLFANGDYITVQVGNSLLVGVISFSAKG